MPTTEERLAALEKQMAAWMDQRPTTYYTHQYSGEEIDAAVGRALTGGALDTSVTNVSNQLGTFTRPNLLDNWYFGRPVDQRGGYVVYAGANLYSDASCTTIAGQVSGGPYAARAISAICVSFTSNATYYCKIGDTGVVRGYTGAFVHTIDRWQLGDGSISFSVVADGIVVKGGNAANTDYIFTRVERLPVGKYTFSVLFADNTANVVLTTRLTDISVVPAVESREASGVLALTWDQPEEFDQNHAYFRIHVPGSAKILAAKLELGSTQTLAHREGDRWVLNEVPEYGEQLRRCQRYCFVWGYSAKQTSCLAVMQAYEPERLFGLIPTPVTMRATPVVTGGSLTTFGGMVTSLWSLNLCANGIRAVASVNGAKFVVGQAVGIENADDNGRVIFSADL